jgi:hypothetical protein
MRRKGKTRRRAQGDISCLFGVFLFLFIGYVLPFVTAAFA